MKNHVVLVAFSVFPNRGVQEASLTNNRGVQEANEQQKM